MLSGLWHSRSIISLYIALLQHYKLIVLLKHHMLIALLQHYKLIVLEHVAACCSIISLSIALLQHYTLIVLEHVAACCSIISLSIALLQHYKDSLLVKISVLVKDSFPPHAQSCAHAEKGVQEEGM